MEAKVPNIFTNFRNLIKVNKLGLHLIQRWPWELVGSHSCRLSTLTCSHESCIQETLWSSEFVLGTGRDTLCVSPLYVSVGHHGKCMPQMSGHGPLTPKHLNIASQYLIVHYTSNWLLDVGPILLGLLWTSGFLRWVWNSQFTHPQWCHLNKKWKERDMLRIS